MFFDISILKCQLHIRNEYIVKYCPQKMNILITGIHGFVGSNLVIDLKEHHSLYGLDIVAPEKEGVIKNFSWKDIGKYSANYRY